VRVDFAEDSSSAAVRGALEARAVPVRDMEQAADRVDHLRRHWRELTPAVLIAARLTRAPVDGLQAAVWRELLREWTDAPTPATTLYDDLLCYVGPAGEEPDVSALTGFLPYATGALRAAVALAFHRPDPEADRWADIYLQFELFAERSPTPRTLAMRMPAAFLTATIGYPVAWAAVARLLDPVLTDDPLTSDLVAQLVRVTGRAGYPLLVQAVRKERAAGRPGGPVDTASIAAAALVDDEVEEVLDRTRQYLAPVPQDQRAALIDELAAVYLRRFPGRAAQVQVWWAWRHLYDERVQAAELALDSIPLHDPEQLLPQIGARLLGARAAVQSAHGRIEPAVKLWRRAIALVRDEPGLVTVRYWAQVQLADLLADGAPDESFTLLSEAAYGSDGYRADADILGRLAILHLRRDRRDLAIDLLREAQRYAVGNPVAERRYAALCSQLLADAKRDGEALDQLEPAASGDVATMLAEAAAWATLLARDAVPPDRVAYARSVPALLTALAGQARAAGALRIEAALLARRAELVQLTDPPAADRLWVDLVRLETLPDPAHLAQAARVHAATGDLDGMRRLLAAVPAALARRYGGVTDVDLLVREPRALMSPLAAIARTVRDTGTWADLRLVAELQRDAIGRAKRARHGGARTGVATWLGEVDPVVAAAAPLVVIEFATIGRERLICFLTRISSAGITSAPVELADVNPVLVEKTLAAGLAGHSTDPLAVPQWQALSASMVDQLSRHAHDGDHLVFLHEQAFSNLPWHAMAGDRWTVSYAAGWTHLASVLRPGPAPRDRLGVCFVPRADEEPGIAAHLRSTRDRLVELPGTTVVTTEPDDCDSDFTGRVLQDTDVAVLLCHGYANHRDLDTGVVVAAGGRLPPRDSLAPALAAHRFGRRDVQQLSGTARTVFSAACSSGYTYSGGLGDRLGLGSALSRSGTTAFVAPMWEVEAADVLPVLERTIALYLGGTPLAAALRTATTEAAGAGPDRTVLSLTLEGNWQ
jgi:tetratricopeptide (TPR) repeat protein